MVSLTLDQAKIALECVDSDIATSAFNECDYYDVNLLVFYLERAELAQRLRKAIETQVKG